jgi:glutamate carboxypeptidase
MEPIDLHDKLRRTLLEELRAATPTMVEQLAELVNAESSSSDLSAIKACAEVIATLGAKITGTEAEEIDVDGRRHLRWQFGGEEPRVVLVGHFERWPFHVEDGRATGPGTFDMKAGIVQMFHALAALPPTERDGLACVLTSDEELGSQTSRALIEDTARGARAALILEPSADGALKVARKGTSMYELQITGRAAHAGNEPEKGANATVELAHQVLAIGPLARPDLGTTVTPTVASSGTTTNTVPAHAVLHIDVRCSVRDEQDRVDRAFRQIRPVVDGTRIDIVGGPNRPPLDREASAALFEMAGRVADRLGLGSLEGVAVGGGSDGNFTAGLGVPTLDGLGAVGTNAHAEGEYVLVDAMAERAALLAGLIASIHSDA